MKTVDASLLAGSPVGTLVPISGYDPRAQREYNTFAFLPMLPPDEVQLSAKTYVALAEAASLVARADQAVTQLPNPELLTRQAIRKEALSTSAIEGTYAAMEDVLKADFVEPSEISPEVEEIHNFVTAAETATVWIKEKRPITIALLEHLQGLLVHGTSSDNSQAGRVRTTDVFIGLKGAEVENARFVPCPHGHHLRDGLLAWEGWINKTSDDMHLLARMAVGHYQFETLHPFNDGNGRLGRLVLLLQLMAAGELSHPVVALSPWLESRRHRYQDHLFNISAFGDFDPWVRFFCEGAAAQARSAVERIRTLVALKDRMVVAVRQSGAKGTAVDIAGDLIGYPLFNVKLMQERYSVSYQSANNAVSRLVDLGLVQPISDRKWGRIFACEDAMRILVR